jgi:transcriptional regulator with XRE-family HTH domain
MTKTKEIQRHIAEKVRELRLGRHWTQSALAGLLGISQNRLSEIERDKGSFSAEQLILLLKTFNVSLDYFVPSRVAVATDSKFPGLQNALARLGASNLLETTDILPSEKLDQAHAVIREVLVAADSTRQITALAPVFIVNARHLNLNKLKFDFEKSGSLNRFGWLLDNLFEAVKHECDRPLGRRWEGKYGEAELLLLNARNLLLPAFLPLSESPEEVLEQELLGVGEKTLKEVRESRSPLSKKWRILTRIQPGDFIHALREAHAAD